MTNKIKVLLVGSRAIGKSQLATSLAGDISFDNYSPTMGVDCKPYRYFDNDVLLYDVGSRFLYTPLSTSYYKTAEVIALCFSPYEQGTINHLTKLIEHAKSLNPSAHFVLVGLKLACHQAKMSQIDTQDIYRFLQTHDIRLYVPCHERDDFNQIELNHAFFYQKNIIDKLNTHIHYQERYEKFWLSDSTPVENIKKIMLNFMGLKQLKAYLPFFQIHPCLTLIKTLKRYPSEPESLCLAKQLLADLKQLTLENNDSFCRRLAFIDDKITILDAKARIVDSFYDETREYPK